MTKRQTLKMTDYSAKISENDLTIKEKKLISDVLQCIERGRNKYCIVDVIQGVLNKDYNRYVMDELYQVHHEHYPAGEYESMYDFIKRISQYFLIVEKLDKHLVNRYFSIICRK